MSGPTKRHPGRRPKLGERVPAFTRTAVELSGHVASLGTEKVAEVLRVTVADLEPMLAGRIGVSKTALRTLRRLA